MDWQGRRKGKYSGKRERCDGVATELRVFTSHVQLSVAGAPGTRTRLGRKASFPLSPPHITEKCNQHCHCFHSKQNVQHRKMQQLTF